MKSNVNKKTVSAIVPNYNYADFIIERLDSILNQIYPVSELIVLDDASSDNSVEVIEKKIDEINRRYPQIKTKFIKNKVNSGGCVFSQWQKGIREATGDYIWIAEADDSADKHFLETAMKKFEEYPSAVLFYSDSYRINQDGKILSKTCSDWADMWGKGRWSKDFFNNGVDEVINYLGETNPILNVSSVVWKNSESLISIFEEAKEYKVAGDWYIYTRVLENGDIVYSAKPLNRYRKHDKGSASTIVKLSTEYKEVVTVQDRVAKKYDLSDENLEWQKVRRRGMGMVENEKNIGDRGRIAWFVPEFGRGSGGHNTIFQNANELIRRGFQCDIYVKPKEPRLPVELFRDLEKWYGEFLGDVFNDYVLAREYDMVIATGWDTVEYVYKTNCKNKVYFIQDYEPWFFPMGEDYIGADMSYKYGLINTCIGNWLPIKLKKEYGIDVLPFCFGADTETYKVEKTTKKEKAICFIYQPGKPRRCSELGLRALEIVHSLRPEVKIYLFGSEKSEIANDGIEHLGMLDTCECNELYNKCKVGLCLSSSNPSRIPFEMMAAGLPVVDLYLENNLYDFPEGGCLLAEPEPSAIASAILSILDDDKKQNVMSKKGLEYMKGRSLSRGYDEFEKIIDSIIRSKEIKSRAPIQTYKAKAVEPRDYNSARTEKIVIKTKEEVWRENLTILQRVYLKIRYLLIGR